MRAIAIAFLAFVLFGIIAGVAYQVGLSVAGAGAAGAAGAAAAYPYHWGYPGFFFPFGFLFPLLFLFLIFAMVAAIGRRGGHGYGGHWGGQRMSEEWHRELHEREKTAGAEKADR